MTNKFQVQYLANFFSQRQLGGHKDKNRRITNSKIVPQGPNASDNNNNYYY